MGTNMNKMYTYNEGDELYTQDYAVYPILKFIPKNAVVWECAERKDLNGNISKMLRSQGIKVIQSSIHHGDDFFKTKVPNGITHIITNPPFSLKNQFLKRCYELDLPFALLLPIPALGGDIRVNLFKQGLELLIFDKRISYIGSKKSPPFASAWFCKDILPSSLIFENLNREIGDYDE